MDPQPRNLAQLAPALESAWLNIPVNTFRNLIDSLPARLAAVRSAKGEDNQWITIDCNYNGEITEYILIQDFTYNGLAICEVEVYVKDEGYTEKGDIRIVCERNTWTGPNLQCEEILCDTVVGNESLIGGEWHIQGRSSKLSIGTRRSLVCREGFYMTGEPGIVTCLGNGSWSKTSATCIANQPEKKDYLKITAIAVGVTLIVLLLGVTIFLIQKKRSREVVVIYALEDDGYTRVSCHR
ncbi:c4b-binding protein [Caerostris darwini]|uniref:C4b-binding protein n=1 Tax=Caerostris darwini TaxID=1538125 RepID=A0AAV4T823_9ARAC|nr:c4b-binding protein [Caerostris darwini]